MATKTNPKLTGGFVVGAVTSTLREIKSAASSARLLAEYLERTPTSC